MNDLETLIKIAIPLGIIIASFLFGFVLEKSLKKFCNKISATPKLEPYTILFQSFQGIVVIWLTLGGIALALPFIKLPDTLYILTEKVLISIFLASATFLASRLAVSFIRIYSTRNESTLPLTSLFEYLTKVLIFIIGFLIIIQSLGIKITALVAAFGIGSLSIGLAFQNTLTNLISGVNIIISRKIRPGDYIKLKEGEEGYVMDVELKYTVIKDISNNTIVIPNSQLIDASFKNYSLPEEEMLLPIMVAISYESDLEKVEQITLNVAKKIMETVEGGVPEYEPFLRYEKFDYFSINFTIYLKVKEYYDLLIIRHEFIKTLYKTYQLEGIKMPFPLGNNYLLKGNTF
jgi:small-conductance mechanosensitive channel